MHNTSSSSAPDHHHSPTVLAGPGTRVTVVGWLAALWCVGFAAVNIVYEGTDRFSTGPYAEYASGLTVLNWLVVGLKIVGAAVALLSVAKRPVLLPPTLVTVLVWGAFATLGLYTLGNVMQAVAMVSGLAGDADRLGPAGVGYVLFFLAGAAGFGVLAASHYRRSGARKGAAVLGVLGAPVLLGLVLLAVPALLVVLGIMPSY
ncbi:hypothetical protein [Allosalinactinospora lopnorensis]|uniref:hypothetical protein n=1 Tax=Allosalinactinospora lopnorensis TaxID=1352348 RepID=UPI000623DC46|nr:hypothetical protein [Allosalinactinospora lopnorensis]